MVIHGHKDSLFKLSFVLTSNSHIVPKMRAVPKQRQMRSSHSMSSSLEDVEDAATMRSTRKWKDSRLVLHHQAESHDKGLFQEALEDARQQQPSVGE